MWRRVSRKPTTGCSIEPARYGMYRWLCLLVIVALGTPVLVHSQAHDEKPVTFEVASVKVNNSGSFAKEIGPAPDGRFHATNVAARDLIAFAYGISQDSTAVRIVSVPRWVDDERYDV